MLSISPSKTAESGSSYFAKDAYYATEGKTSQWYGKGAEQLGLSGPVLKTEFDTVINGFDLASNALVKNAGSDDIKDESGNVIKNGRTAYIDLTFSAPKSVSILSYKDRRIEDAHNRAVEATIAELEKRYSYTRKVVDGEVRITQSDNLCMARINHYESRELDPQLHSHIVLMNLTHGDDGKWRSIEAGKIYQDQLYLGQYFRNELAKELSSLGYETEVTDRKKGLFEIRGISEEIRDEFSVRRKQVLEAKEKYKDYNVPDAKKSEYACLDSRRPKTDSKIEEIRTDIENRLANYGQSLEEIQQKALSQNQQQPPSMSMEECIRYAIEELSDKQSAFTEKEVIEKALKGGLGNYTAEELENEFFNTQDVELLGNTGKYPSTFYTTDEIQKAESQILEWAQDGVGESDVCITYDTLQRHLEQIRTEGIELTPGQQQAVAMICTSSDRLSLIQGDAGAGKSFAMGTVKTIMESEGKTVRGFAPTGKASQELEAAGVESMTVDKYLASPHHQTLVGKDEVWLIDESGMMGSRKMKAFLDKAAEKGAKVVLIGDTKQFQSVEQGKIFQDLQDHTQVSKTEITEVKRQQTYHGKQIVAAIKQGEFSQAFDILEDMEGLKEIESRADRLSQITAEYLADCDKGVQSVVLTSTNADKNEINTQIRDQLKRIGAVENGSVYKTYQKHDVDSISRNFAQSYKDGQVVVFKRDCDALSFGSDKQKSAGIQGTIKSRDDQRNAISVEYYDKSSREYKTAEIDLKKHSAKFQTYDLAEKQFGAGDRIIFTKNDKCVNVANGESGVISAIDQEGNATIQIGKNKTVECNLNNRGERAYNYLDHAYCLTNHKSQGSSYDKAIVNADISSQNTNYNAFYVQATRMKQDLTIYTNDRVKLSEQAQVRQNKSSTLDTYDFSGYDVLVTETLTKRAEELNSYQQNASRQQAKRDLEKGFGSTIEQIKERDVQDKVEGLVKLAGKNGYTLEERYLCDVQNQLINRKTPFDEIKGGLETRINKTNDQFNSLNKYVAGRNYRLPNDLCADIRQNLFAGKEIDDIKADLGKHMNSMDAAKQKSNPEPPSVSNKEKEQDYGIEL